MTIVCERLASLNPYYGNVKKYRDYWSAIFGIDDSVASDETQWRSTLAENRALTHAILSLDWVINTRKEYTSLTKKRNQVNHGGFTGDMSEDVIIQTFEDTVDKCIELMSQDMIQPEIVADDGKNKIFLNISNHPVAKWSANQIEEAQKYGTIDEIGFPVVPPDMDNNEYNALIEECLAIINKKISGKNATVHIMGEMTLTFALVKRLQARGVRCVASTTERCVRETDDGAKESIFKFVRFREYEC